VFSEALYLVHGIHHRPDAAFTRLLRGVDLVSSGKQGLFIIGKPGKMEVYSAEHQEGTMPDFATVSLEEAQVNTTSGRQRKFINEYTRYMGKG
jgi:hypothetical protein